MADIMQDFKHLDSWTEDQLFERQAQIKNSAAVKDLTDEQLQEILAISRVVRRRTTAPKAKASSRAAAPTLDAL